MKLPENYIFEFRVPIVLYGEETHLVFAPNEEEARNLLERYGNHAAYGRKIYETEFLFTDAEVLTVESDDGRKDPCEDCTWQFETNEGEAGCSLTMDDRGFILCENVEVCPLHEHCNERG